MIHVTTKQNVFLAVLIIIQNQNGINRCVLGLHRQGYNLKFSISTALKECCFHVIRAKVTEAAQFFRFKKVRKRGICIAFIGGESFSENAKLFQQFIARYIGITLSLDIKTKEGVH